MLSHYGVELSAGRWGEEQVCCPAHGERRASMRVNVEKGVAFCHACGFKGNAIHLVMAMESCSREEACGRTEKILDAAGVEIKGSASRGRYQRPREGRTRVGGRRYVPPGRRSA